MKSGLGILVALLALPDADAEALFECWKKLRRPMPVADAAGVAAKTVAMKAGSLHGKPYLREELQTIRNAIAAGLTQAETVKKVRKQFGNGRTAGAYHTKVNEVAKEFK